MKYSIISSEEIKIPKSQELLNPSTMGTLGSPSSPGTLGSPSSPGTLGSPSSISTMSSLPYKEKKVSELSELSAKELWGTKFKDFDISYSSCMICNMKPDPENPRTRLVHNEVLCEICYENNYVGESNNEK